METLKPLAMIVAVSSNGVIGRDGGLPWKISADLKYFRKVTTSPHGANAPPRAIIMGRKTHESIGKALPNRTNIVVTTHATKVRRPVLVTEDPVPRFAELQGVSIADECWVAPSLDAAIELARETDPEPIIIGGSSLYLEALDRVTRIYVTLIDRIVDGDVFVPAVFPIPGARTSANWIGGEWTSVEEFSSSEHDELSSHTVCVTWHTLVRKERS